MVNENKKYKRYCKNILKQYGKHIKAFEKRLDNPIDLKENNISWTNSKGNTFELERQIQVSWFLKKGSSITSYEDLVDYSK